MFLDKRFVLGNELVQKMGIHIANISALRNQFEDNHDHFNIRKMNNCNFINKECPKLPRNIQLGLKGHEFTDMSDKLPVSWVRDEYSATEKGLFDSGIVIKREMIEGKHFYIFCPDFVKTIKNKIGYVLNAEETQKCRKNKQILGSIQLSNDRFFTWY